MSRSRRASHAEMRVASLSFGPIMCHGDDDDDDDDGDGDDDNNNNIILNN